MNYWIFFLPLLLMSSLYSLEFKTHDNNSETLNAVMASGKIKAKDTQKLEIFLSSLPNKKNTAIYFDSQGGNLREGMKLGEFFKKHKIKTVVQGGEVCASACALAFLGGTDRKGNRWMSTTTTSKLGFHAFSYSDGTTKEDMDLIQRVVGEILEYGQIVEAPMEIFVRNFKTPSNSMYWFNTEESLSLGIKVWDMKNECFVGNSNCVKKDTASTFLKLYFENLKKIPYRSSWFKLSASFRKKVPFQQYEDWWSKKVKNIRLGKLNRIASNNFKVKLYYELNNGKSYCSQDYFILIKRNDNWLIEQQKSAVCRF